MYTKLVGFVQTYQRAILRSNIYVHPPDGVVLANTHGVVILKLATNLNEIQDAGLTWFHHPIEQIETTGFTTTSSEPYIFIKGVYIDVLYEDDYIIILRTKRDASIMINEMNRQRYNINEGTM